MKLFQKSALAVAIAAVPFLSVNAMEALDDAALSEMTGQAGVTIETTVDGDKGITIGSILYTDTVGGDIGGGSVMIRGIDTTDGAGVTTTSAGITLQGQVWNSSTNDWDNGNSTTAQTIDIDVNGNLITETKAVGGQKDYYNDPLDNASGVAYSTTAQKISVGQVLLQSSIQAGTANGAQLVSNLEMTMESGDSKAHIVNLSGGDASGYTGSHVITGATTGLARALNAENAYGAGSGKLKQSDGSSDVKAASMAIVTNSKSRIVSLKVDALDGAIGIRNMSYGGGTDGTELMESTQVIWAVGGTVAEGGGVYIQGSESTGTLTIGELHIANNNIGRIQISDINQAGSVTRIYGH